MRALELVEPFKCEVIEVDDPIATSGSVVVDVHRVGVCGTDVEFYKGEMSYLHDGNAHFPLRLGHEWMGVVSAIGHGVDPRWLGRRVTGDTMLGCGTCRRCRAGHQHVCATRKEVGVRANFPGALAEKLVVPASSVHGLPDNVDDALGALVEPGANAWRSVQAANVREAERLLVLGPGTIGLLAAMFATSLGVEVHVAGVTSSSLDFARTLGFDGVCHVNAISEGPWDAVINATNDVALPAKALDMVEPGGRVVYIGIGTGPSAIDSRELTLKDVTAVGLLSGSPALDDTIAMYASGTLDPRPLISAVVSLSDVGAVLAGIRPAHAGDGPKIQVDPRT